MSASLARATVAVRRVIKETIIHVPYLLSFINVAAGTVENAPLESQLFFGDMYPTFASEKTPIGPTELDQVLENGAKRAPLSKLLVRSYIGSPEEQRPTTQEQGFAG